jgi:glycosyltransferase involved in cell wall biosynthesis
MRVTFVSPFAQRAGSERYLGLVLEGIPREHVRDVVFLQDGPFVEDVRGRGFPVTVWPTGAGPAAILGAARRLRRHLARDRPDLVHANGIKAALVSVLATAGTRTPVLWVKHDLSFDRSLARPVALGCRLVVGVSEAAVRVFGPRLRRKVRVVPNALPPVQVAREQRGAGRSPEIALVGRLYAMKGQHELLEAAPDLAARVPEVRISFVGPEDPSVPEYAAKLRKRTTELGLDGVVTFVGEVDDAAGFLARCDVVAIPSVPAERGNTESFSLVALEAMAVGTPVVAYAEGGLPEVLADCALLVQTGDRRGLADALVRVLEDGELAASLAACGRERVAREFSLERMLESLQACYREARG